MKTKILLLAVSTLYSLLSFATSYTWNGATSTAWGTSTNWTPNGVPGAADNVTIVTATNQPTYNGVAGVTNLTMTSGTLNLGGYTINVSGTGTFNGGTITNGKVNISSSSTLTFAGTTMNCKVTGTISGHILLNGSVFNDTTRFTKTGGFTTSTVGGNIFNGYTVITNQSSSGFYLNNTSPYKPDTANNIIVFNHEGSGTLITGASNSSPNVFYDKVILNKKSGSNSSTLEAGSNGKVEFHDTIEVTNVTTNDIYIGHYSTSKVTLTDDATVVVGSAGFTGRTLYFRYWDKHNTTPINLTLTGTAKWEVLSDNIINGNLTITAPQISTIQSTYNGNVILTKTGATDNWMSGDNVFNGEFTLTNNSSAAIGFGTGTIPDTFRLKATFITYNNNLSVAHAYSGHYFAGDVYFKTLGTGAINVSNYGAGSFAGNIYLTSTSTGAINFGQSTSGTLTLASGKTIIEDTDGFNSGSLLLRRFVKNGTTAMNLDFGTSAGVTFGPYTTINGNVTYSGGEFYLNGTTFNNTVSFTKKGSVNATSSGGNVFNGAATFNSNGTGTLVLANTTGDDFNDDVTFIKTANKNFYPANVGTTTFAGDITFSGANTGLAFGKSNGLAVLDGGNAQVFTARTGDAARKLKIAKSANHVLLDGELMISDSLILTNGILETEGSDMIVLEDNCKLGGVSDASFVAGKVKKIGNDAFTFPVGKYDQYRSITISAPTNTTDAYTAEYFLGTSNDSYSHSSKDAGIAQLSRAEYWKLDRNTGSSNLNVTLGWESSTSCTFGSTANLKVAAWNGTTWKDKGNGGTTGNTTAGTIVTNGTSDVYGAYSLATTSTFTCACESAVADAGDDVSISIGGRTLIGTTGVTGLSYKWTPTDDLNNPDLAMPWASPRENTSYILTAGCANSKDTVLVTIIPDECGNTDSEAVDILKMSSECGDLNEYIVQDEEEIKVIKVNVHVMQKSDGTGFCDGYTENQITDAFYSLFLISSDLQIWNMNYYFANNQPPIPEDADNLFGNSNYYVPDTKIRFKLMGVYFHPNDNGYANHSSGTINDGSHGGNYVYNNFGVNKETEINIFYVRNLDGVGRGSASTNRVNMAGHFNDLGDIHPGLINHELGHSISLFAHTMAPNGPSSFTGGRTNNTGTGDYYNNSDYYLQFNVNTNEDCTIESVGVYANGAGTRTIKLVDGSGITLEQEDFYIEDGNQNVLLNWHVNPGTGYSLRTVGDPQLFRNTPSSTINYPYNIGNMLTITGSNQGSGYYYFFYNWKVKNNGCPDNDDTDDGDDIFDTYYPDPAGWYDPGTVHENCGGTQYITTNNLMGYNTTKTHLSPQQVGRIHRYLFNNMHRLDCESQITNQNRYITNGHDEEWLTAKIMTGNLIVEAGATLTVKCIVGFPPGTKAIVERGGKLIIDGGSLVSSCGSIWEGVEVWGNPSYPQGTKNVYGVITSYNANQGRLEMINDARISHAICGVRLQKAGEWSDYNGGIIRAEDSYFTNNRKAVSFMTYNKYNSFSNFDNVEFKCDKPMRSDNYIDSFDRRLGVKGFVGLWDVKGVNFKDCTFKNNVNYSYEGVADSFDPDIRGTGIGSVDASYTVTSTDIAAYSTRTNFDSLTIGVHTGSTFKNLRTVNINNSQFNKTQMGIVAESGTNNKFTENRFRVPQSYVLSFPGTPGYGIYLKHSYNTKIEDNIFEYASSTPGTAINWGVVNGGWEWNIANGGLIKNNSFNSIDFGTQVELNNPHLKISCNEYTNQDIEWWINPQYPGYFLGPQGTGCAPILNIRGDNLFYDGGQHIWSYAQYWKYWAPNVSSAMPAFGTPAINGDAVQCVSITSRTCTTGGGTIGDEKALKIELDDVVATLESEYADVVTNLDNGQKATMLTNIANSGYSNATLTTDLVANSLLSDEVLIAACNRSPFFTSGQFTDIIEENAPVSNSVWLEIEDAYAGTVPAKVIEAQEDALNRTLEAIKRDMDAVKTELFITEYTIVSLYAEADSMPALVHYLVDSLGSKDFKKLAVGVSLQYDTVEWARAILENLVLEDENDTAYYDYYDVAVSLAQNGLTWFGMNGTQKNKVKELSLTDFEVAVNAQAVLTLVDDSVYFRIPEMAVDSSGKWDGEEPNIQQQEPEETIALKTITVYPNPSSNSFNVNYLLEKEASEVRIEVYDLTGRTLLIRKIGKSSNGNINLDLGECLGIYILRMFADERQIHTEKLVCIQK